MNLAISVTIAAILATCDYLYTRRGNDRGRWDLIIDETRETLQIPAVGAYDEPTTVPLDQVKALQVRTILRPDDDDNSEGFYRLNVVCRETRVNREYMVPHDVVTDHTVAQSRNKTELEALAEWLRDALPVETEIEEHASASTLGSLMTELSSTSHRR